MKLLSFLTVARFIGWFRPTPVQQRSLLHTIQMCATYRLPIAPTIRALAEDETGYHAERLYRLADLLESDWGLPEALERIPRLLSDSARSQIKFGIESGRLEAAAADAIKTLDDRPHDSMQNCYESLVRLAMTLVLLTLIVSFVMIKIVPEIRTIFEDFELPLTPSMDWVIAIADFTASFGAFFVLFALGFFLWVRFGDPLRFMRRSLLYPIARLFGDVDTPDLFRQIALTRESGKPIAGSLATLAGCHHNPRTRQRILRAWSRVEFGEDVWTALREQHLITTNETRVIRASETLDNTPWVLRQLATSREEKTNRRLQIASSLFPAIVLLPIAAIVAFFAIGMLSSLVSLISNLS